MSVPPETGIILPGETSARLAYSIPEAARLLGVCKGTIYNRIREKNGGLPAVKIGRVTRVLADDLRSYLAARPKVSEESHDR